jgi:predicted nucleotidyltransferase
MFDQFLKRVAKHTVSIVLAGSQVDGTAHEDSDIDLIIITKNKDEADVVHGLADDLNKSELRPILDCKVFAKQDLSSAKSGPENLFLWICLTHGRLISGIDVTKDVDLNTQTVLNLIWRCVQNAQEVIDWLDSQVHFTGCCYHVYNSLATIYFVNRFILNTVAPTETKRDFIKSHLGDQYLRIRERYYWVVRHLDVNLSQKTLKIPLSVDKRFKKVDYLRILDQTHFIVSMVESTFDSVKKWECSHTYRGA